MTFENLGEMSLSEMIYEEVSGKYPLKLTTVLDTDGFMDDFAILIDDTDCMLPITKIDSNSKCRDFFMRRAV